MQKRNKQTLAEEMQAASMDRMEATQPKLARVGIRAAMIAAADSNASHKAAYKIHQAARRSKGA